MTLIGADNRIGPQYIGHTFRVHDNNLSHGAATSASYRAGCGTNEGGNGADWNGRAEGGGSSDAGMTAPDYLSCGSGTQAGPGRTGIVGVQACEANTPVPYNCVMFLPLAKDDPMPTDRELWVFGLAAFSVSSCGSNCHNALLLRDYVTSGKGTNDWNPDLEAPVVICLTE